jgi:hypothetical protein
MTAFLRPTWAAVGAPAVEATRVNPVVRAAL